MFNDVKYRITEKQSMYAMLHKSSIFIAAFMGAGAFNNLTLINELVSIFVRALIGALCGTLVAAIALRLFIKRIRPQFL